MLNPSVIRRKPRWLFFTGSNMWVTIYPHVYKPNGVPIVVSILAHESIHFERQKEMGKWKWLLRYCFSKKFRLNEEVVAFIEEISYIPEYCREAAVNRFATQLSSRAYCWAAKDKAAAAELIRSAAAMADITIGR